MPPKSLPIPPRKGKWVDFAIPGIDVQLQRWDGARGENVPDINPGYVFREELVREIAWAAWPHDGGLWTPCMLVGPKGCGKTSLVLQIAAQCNINVLRMNLNVGTSVRHLKGRIGAKKGETVYVPGIATEAMERGWWLLFDEISGATPPVALSLFPILEPDGAVMIEEAQPPRYIVRHPDFRIFASDNTIGAMQEDTRFNYSGTNPDVNEALLDRFGSVVQISYLGPEMEHEAIKAIVPEIPDLWLEAIIRTAQTIRQAETGITFSTRMVMDWTRRLAAGQRHGDGSVTPHELGPVVLDTAYPAFLHKMRSKIDRDAVVEIIRRWFDLGPENPGPPE